MLPLSLLALVLVLTPATLAVPPWYEQYRHPRVIVPQSYYEVLRIRSATAPNPHAVTDVACLDPNAHIISHDELAATLAICGGIAGAASTRTCGRSSRSGAGGGGRLAETEGRSGTARFVLRAVRGSGAAVTISKGAWVQCVRAAREACPTGSMSGVCLGGASRGNVMFTLTGV
ncbi:hypothetical protein BT67DRAFT_435472 [Trichocladium antarcticum]|uniref:Uncharacterized protein n=1 Tax=Trichocladium antarcticum TaxID=1450529 RepID=A0AAN6UGN6_9PEZI|nr:hypothetical protein BT67DRAFT_435472 [Trichocladium antarcticum]